MPQKLANKPHVLMLSRLALFVLTVLLATAFCAAPAKSAPTWNTYLYDHFNGTDTNPDKWHIPTWKSSSDGTYVGRTQFRVTQNSPLPPVSGSNVQISVQSYNPTGFSFYGTDLISNQSFALEQGLVARVRTRMDPPATPGVVGGIFLYALKAGSTTLHDEVDFELLGNRPAEVQTNVYAGEPLGAGHPEFSSYASGSISDYHTYEIGWWPDRVVWSVDGIVVREDTSHVPSGPMDLHLNMWAPAADWPVAYSAGIQPTSLPKSNQIWRMSVDSAAVYGYGEGSPGNREQCKTARRALAKAKREVRRAHSSLQKERKAKRRLQRAKSRGREAKRKLQKAKKRVTRARRKLGKAKRRVTRARRRTRQVC